MGERERDLVRGFIEQTLRAHNDEAELYDDESLFLSGRLDSLAVTKLVVFLEEHFQVDFAREEFDVGLLDTVDQIGAFALRNGVAAAE